MKLVFSLILLAVLSTPALAARGVVAYNTWGCDYFIVETTMGYALLEWYGGNDPSVGDTIVGDFESYGMKRIFNVTADQSMRVWVEDFWLSKDDAIEQYLDQCQ